VRLLRIGISSSNFLKNMKEGDLPVSKEMEVLSFFVISEDKK
jgi:hypothetical protein